jgi:hypothetical protein
VPKPDHSKEPNHDEDPSDQPTEKVERKIFDDDDDRDETPLPEDDPPA